jgi:hypothetical protein
MQNIVFSLEGLMINGLLEGEAQVRTTSTTYDQNRTQEAQGGGPKCCSEATCHLSYLSMQT